MNKQPWVSVIVPVYNAQKYLEQCLQSLADQTAENFEVICVDDGSTDASVELIRGFMQRDERFSLIQQKNQYAGVARNNGIEHAKGEYLLFLDADDFFHPELIAKAYAQAKKTDADVVLFGAKTYDMERDALINTPYLMRHKLIPAKEVFSHKDVPEYFLQMTNSCPWLQLYRKQYILDEGIRFQALPNTNDAFFVIVALSCAKRMSAVKEDLVYYRINTGVSTQDKKYRNPTCFLTAYLAIYRELNRRGIYKELEQSFASKVVMSCAHHIRSTVNPQALSEVYEAICGEELAATGVFSHPCSYYFDPNKAKLVLSVPAAMKVFKKRSADQESIRILAQGKAETPVKTSVIVPVVSSSPYLKEAMDALTGQSLREVEILCVVEETCEAEKEILLKYAGCDARVSVMAAERICTAAARNIALQRAQGEYVYFADGCNLIAENALDTAYEYAKAQGLDILCFDGDAFCDEADMQNEVERRKERYCRSHTYRGVYLGEQFVGLLSRDKENQPMLGQQLICREHLTRNELQFDEQIPYVSWYAFSMCSLIAAQRVGYMHERMYRHRVCRQKKEPLCFAQVLGWFRAYLRMDTFVCGRALQKNNEEAIGNIIKAGLWMAQDQYVKLDDRETDAYRLLDSGERRQFGVYVAEPAGFKRSFKQQNRSAIYRIYRLAAYVQRKIPDGLYRLREYGVKRTAGQMINKMKNKLKG